MTSKNVSDVDNIDSKSFDAASFFNKLLKTRGVEDLLKIDTELNKDIKILDGNMKTLVHGNYRKFIHASDTIRNMNTNIEAMEAQMTQLDVGLERIEKLSNSLSTHLGEKQSEIEQLSGVHQVLHQLQFLAEVPLQLEKALKNGTYIDGIQYYNRTYQILEQYQHIASFKQIKDNSEKLLDEIKNILISKYDDVELQPQSTLQYYGMLLAMKESLSSVRQRFITRRLEVLYGVLNKWKIFKINPLTPDEPKQVSYKRFISNLHTDFFPPFINYVALFYQMFSDSEEEFKESVDKIFTYYIDTVSFHLLGSESPEAMVTCLETIGNEFKEAHKDYKVKRLDLSAKGDSLISSITAALIGHHFDKFLKSYLEDVSRSSKALQEKESSSEKPPQAEYYQEIVLDLEKKFNDGLSELFATVQPFALVPSQLLGSTVASHIKSSMSNLNSNLVACRLNDKAVPTKNFLLVLVRVLLRIELNAIPIIERKFTAIVQTVARSSLPKTTLDLKEIKESLLESAQLLLEFFVRLHGEKLGEMIQKSLERPNLSRPEPQIVEMIIILLLEEIEKIRDQINRSFTSTVDKSPIQSRVVSTKRSQKPVITPSYGLFTKKMLFFGKLDIDKSAILTAIIKMCLKTFLECVRLTTFGTHGFQQIQVNLEFMRMQLVEYIEDSTLLSIIEEIKQSAEERTVDPIPMEQTIVARICEKAKQKKEF